MKRKSIFVFFLTLIVIYFGLVVAVSTAQAQSGGENCCSAYGTAYYYDAGWGKCRTGVSLPGTGLPPQCPTGESCSSATKNCQPTSVVTTPPSGSPVQLTAADSYQCAVGGVANSGTDTAIGCVPKDLKPFLSFVLRWALGISGGLILLMLIATGYALLTSQGNPEKLQAAKENIVSIFSGLVLIGFSLVLLQVIGANVLILPTF